MTIYNDHAGCSNACSPAAKSRRASPKRVSEYLPIEQGVGESMGCLGATCGRRTAGSPWEICHRCDIFQPVEMFKSRKEQPQHQRQPQHHSLKQYLQQPPHSPIHMTGNDTHPHVSITQLKERQTSSAGMQHHLPLLTSSINPSAPAPQLATYVAYKTFRAEGGIN